MIKRGIISLFLLVFIFTFSPLAYASVSVSADMKYLNNFWWRVRENVNPHLHFECECSYLFSDNVGIGVIPFESYSLELNKPDETDCYLYLMYLTKRVNIKGGYILYDVQGSQERPGKGEVYTNLTFPGHISDFPCYTGLTTYFDIAKSGAAYLEGSFSVDIGSPAKWAYLSVGSIIGYDFGQFVDNEFTVLQLKNSINFKIAEGIFLSPSFKYVVSLNKSFRNSSVWGLNFIIQPSP